MRRKQRNIISLFLAVFMVLCSFSSAFAENISKISKQDVYDAAQKTIEYYHKTYRADEYRGILDWPVLGLFGFNEDVSGPKWTVNGKNGAYWREQEVKKGIGLRTQANTDFQRTIIGVCAAGKDPRNFGGKNLVEIEKKTMLPSGHFADSVKDNRTGKPVGENLVNAHIWGVIALHCAGEPIPNRDECVKWLENQQHPDGGFTFDVKYFDDPEDYKLIQSDVDMTAGALMAFAILGEDESNPHVKRAFEFLREQQLDNGGFHSWGTDNPESCAWAIQAIRMHGQDPMGPEWTNEKGLNPVTSLLRFQKPNGSFVHVLDEENMLPIYENAMSTYEALYGMADAYNDEATYDRLHEKYKGQAQKYLFKDYKPGDYAFDETMDLVYDYILSGYPDGTFKPEKNVTRAEFSKLIINTLGAKEEVLNFKGKNRFKDVPKNNWAYRFVGVCAEKGIVEGINKNEFGPGETITGEQLMAMLVRAMGLEEEANKLNEEGKGWAYGYLEIAKEKGLLYEKFQPKEPVSRAQCSWSLYQLKNTINK